MNGCSSRDTVNYESLRCMKKGISLDIEPGDRIFLYTDGITEVFDTRGEMLGVAGMQNFVREDSRLPLHEMKQSILDKVAAWRDGPATDDISLVLVEVA